MIGFVLMCIFFFNITTIPETGAIVFAVWHVLVYKPANNLVGRVHYGNALQIGYERKINCNNFENQTFL